MKPAAGLTARTNTSGIAGTDAHIRISRHVSSRAGGSSRLFPALLIAALALALLGAAPAANAAPVPGFGPVATNESISGGRTAVDQSTGNVLIVDPGNNEVDVYTPDLAPGGTVTPLTSFPVANPYGIAIDNSTNAVYVTDSDSNRIVRFVSDGAPVPTYSEDAGFSSPALGSGAGEVGNFRSPLAVDPNTGDLLVGDVGNQRVSRYTESGAFVASFDGSDSPLGAFHSILDLAAGPAGTYIVDHREGEIAGGIGVLTTVTRFDAQGAYAQTIDDTHQIIILGTAGDRLLGVGRTYYTAPSSQLYVFSAGVLGALSDLPVRPFNSFGFPAGSEVSGLAFYGGAPTRVYTVTTTRTIFGGPGIDVFIPSPAVEAASFTSPDARSAHLTGAVNPGGNPTTVHFEYSIEGTNSWTSTADVDVGSGTADVPVSADATNLRPNSAYSVRLVATATEPAVTATSLLTTVRTADSAPEVATEGAYNVTSSSATVRGSLTPFGNQTTYYFEYGETSAYGSRAPATFEGVAGNGYTPHAVSRQLTGLHSGTYHYRLVGVSSGGAAYGEDKVLSIEARAYEMISPVSKGGVSVEFEGTGAIAREDGDSIVFGTTRSVYPGGPSGALVPRVLGSRSDAGWASRPIGLPAFNEFRGQKYFYSALAVSKDQSQVLGVSNEKLTPDASPTGWNVYLQEASTGALTFIGSEAEGDNALGVLSSFTGPVSQIGTSADAHKIVWQPNPNGGVMWEAELGAGIRPASVLPDGTLAKSASGPAQYLHETHQVSEDGSRVYFSAAAAADVGIGDRPLYLREEGTETIPISVSHRPGDSSEPVPAYFYGASPDGRYVTFRVFGSQPLTVDAPESPGNVYRYDVDADTMTFQASTSEILGPSQPVVARPGTGMLYFHRGNDQTVYVAREGLGEALGVVVEPGEGSSQYEASQSGRFFAFGSHDRLTAFDNKGSVEIYLYDAQTDRMLCASCPTDGGPQVGEPILRAPKESTFNHYFPRTVLDDGTVYFDTLDPLVDADTNKARDVYSFRDGQVNLISAGTGPANSIFIDATPDGRSVFFATADRLVAQDTDGITDLYVSRVDGGIAAQNVVPPTPCTGEGCQAPAPAVPPAPLAGSESATGPGNPSPKPRKKCKAHKGKKRKTSAGCAKGKQKSNGNRRQGR